MIPKAALAAMLIGVGIKLAHPKEFIHMFRIGKEQLLIFLTTIIVTLVFDLLAGIFAGMLIEIIIHISKGLPISALFKAPIKVSFTDDEYMVEIEKAAIFSNYLGIKSKLNAIPDNMKVTIDFSNSKLVDHSVMDGVHLFQNNYESNGGKVTIIGLDKHTASSSHHLASRVKKK
jgi:MFS superfamily sulfate permease-like transporter